MPSAEEGIRLGLVPELAGYPGLEREVRFRRVHALRFLLKRGQEKCFVEVKSVTLWGADGWSAFPMPVTERGVKHIRELLAARVSRGQGGPVVRGC